MGLIDDFFIQYKKEYDYYETTSKIVANKIDDALRSAGIKAIVTNRAKNPDRLLEKLRLRNEKRETPYKNFDEIYEDICDLSGVRVALYFPSDRNNVGKIIEDLFSPSIQKKSFPTEKKKPSYEKRFSGYWAEHYRIQLQEKDLKEDQRRYSQAKTEIQVASLLMHAWSEVEHDLVYKPLSGTLSDEEYAILDELNGLVMAGEIALERLQIAGENRVIKQKTINDQYELTTFLRKRFSRNIDKDKLQLGNTNLLYEILKNHYESSIPINSPYLKNLINSDINQEAISDQMIDSFIYGDRNRYKLLSKIKKDSFNENDYYNATMGDFINLWIKIEAQIKEKSQKINPNYKFIFSRNNLDKLYSKDEVDRITKLRIIRNNIIHDNESPSLAELRILTIEAKELYKLLSEKNK